MTFRELQAMQTTYELLSPLEPSAQQRVMTWLSSALADTNGAPAAVDEPATAVKPAAEVPAEVAVEDHVAEIMAEQEAPVPEAEAAVPAGRVAGPVAAAEPEVTVEPGPVAEPTPRPRRGRSVKATGPRAAAKAAKTTAAAKPAKAAPGPRSDRPGGDQFLADLAATGSFKALAEKYGKSIGTIGNWANQLREQGYDIPVGRQKNP